MPALRAEGGAGAAEDDRLGEKAQVPPQAQRSFSVPATVTADADAAVASIIATGTTAVAITTEATANTVATAASTAG